MIHLPKLDSPLWLLMDSKTMASLMVLVKNDLGTLPSWCEARKDAHYMMLSMGNGDAVTSVTTVVQDGPDVVLVTFYNEPFTDIVRWNFSRRL